MINADDFVPSSAYVTSVNPGVSVVAPSAQVSPGSSASVVVRIHNSGTTVAAYTVAVLGPAQEWAESPAEPIRLFPGDLGEATVRFNIPVRSGPTAGTHRVGVRVADVTEPLRGTVEEFDLEIASEVVISARLSPMNSSARRTGRHRIQLTNEGNADAIVHLQATDPDERLRCHVAPSAVVPAGDTVDLKLTVALPKRRLFGREPAHPFEVEVVPAKGSAVALSGSLRQRPIVGQLATVGVVAAVALVAGVAAVSRGDEPRSSAQDATSTSGVDRLGTSTSAVSELAQTTAPTPGGGTAGPVSTAPIPVGPSTTTAGRQASTATAVPKPLGNQGPPSQSLTTAEARSNPQPQSVTTVTVLAEPVTSTVAATPVPVATTAVPVPIRAKSTPKTDFDGDGKSDVAIFRPSTGQWHVRNLGVIDTFGESPGDIPVPGDYNGDGTTDVAIFRPSTGEWHVRNLGVIDTFGGLPGDIPI